MNLKGENYLSKDKTDDFSDFGNSMKDAGTAAFASLIFPGLGQAYNCDIYKALSFFAIAFVMVMMSIFLTIASIIFSKIWLYALIVIVMGIIFWIYNIIDAYNEANG